MKTIKHLFALSAIVTLTCPSLSYAVPDIGPVDMDSFYLSLPNAHSSDKLGQLIKAEKIKTPIQHAQAWKIAYISSDAAGRKTLVTGIVVAPLGEVGKGGRPIVAWGHGTTGTAESCGPSQLLNPAQPLNQYFLMNGNSWTDFGIPALEAFIKLGYVVVATDYQGLGGGGKHQYSVSVAQANDMIDSVRAATQLKEAHAGSNAILYGWSEGGGGVITAAGLTDYAHSNDSVNSQINFLGFVALAPEDIAVSLPETIQTEEEANQFIQKLIATFSGSVFGFTHLAESMWGMVAAYPDLALGDVFTPEGVRMVNDVMARKCVHAAADTIHFAYGDSYKKLLNTRINNALAWVKGFRKGSVPPVKPMAPVIIYFGTNDTTVPPVMGQLYQEQMCKLGGNITRVQLPGSQSHFTTPPVSEPLYVKWVADRFAGREVPNGCGTSSPTTS